MAKIVTHTCTRIKRSVTGPLTKVRGSGTNPFGVGIRAGKPKADRAIRKEKAATYQPPKGLVPYPEGVRYEHPYGGAHMHMGDLKVSPCAPGPKVPVKNIYNFYQK